MDNGKSLALEIAKVLNNVPGLLIKSWVKSRKPIYKPNGELLINLGNDAHLHLYSQEFDNPVFSIDTHDKYKGPVYFLYKCNIEKEVRFNVKEFLYLPNSNRLCSLWW